MTKRPHRSRRTEASEPGPSAKERMAGGKALRERVPRTSQAQWQPPPGRPDRIELLKHSDRGRLAELLPIRYARMRQSPFAFFRGAAALMAADLATTPSTRLRVQACGDCHVANFGGFGSPERLLVFDINDFDETLPAPWEWDVKRLGASIVLAGRELGFGERHCADTVRTAVRSYREHMREYAGMRALDVWYSHLDAEIFIADAKTGAARKRWRQVEKNAAMQTAEHVFPRITAVKNGRPRILDLPPLVYHPAGMARIGKRVRDMFERYRRSLPEERRVILDRYQIVDIARKVVGVGSVGTRCAVALLMAGAKDPLFLQFKQAMRMKIDVTQMSRQDWIEYVEICGWTLARAHARTGDPAQIAGYLGKSAAFDRAIEEFSLAYADQTERDHAALVKAIRAGKIQARPDATA